MLTQTHSFKLPESHYRFINETSDEIVIEGVRLPVAETRDSHGKVSFVAFFEKPIIGKYPLRDWIEKRIDPCDVCSVQGESFIHYIGTSKRMHRLNGFA